MSFWSELKRRNVFKVSVAYLIVAWLIVQVVSIAFPAFHMPTWTVTFVMSLLIVGFPVVLIFAWAFEITPEGLKRTHEVPDHESITHLTGQKLNYIVTGLLVVAVAYILIDNYFLDRRFIETEVTSRVAELAPPAVDDEEAAVVPPTVDEEETLKTIAVIPFVNLSPDPDQEYFVDGLTEELLNSLAQITDLRVTARTSSFTFKGSDKKVQEIAEELGVANVLEGSVRKAGNAIRITAQLIRAVDGFHIWSKTYDRELKDIFEVQEEIATAVVDELKVTLGVGQSLKQLGGTDNPEAYTLYLLAQGQRNEGTCDANKLALESLDKALALDPNYALAWALKSQIHNPYAAQCVQEDLVAFEQDAALSAAQRAIELEPKLVTGYYALSNANLTSGKLIEAEYTYREAIKLTNELSWSNETSDVPIHYFAVGKTKSIKEILERLRRNDPLNPMISGMYMNTLAALGDIQGAEKEIERGNTLFGDNLMFANSLPFVHLVTDTDIIIPDELSSNPIWSIVEAHLDSPKKALEELHRLYNNDVPLVGLPPTIISFTAAYFDDPEFALAASEKLFGENLSNLNLWFPVMHDVRQLPRFKEFVREIGLVNYWEQFGYPDLCHPTDDGDFECD